MPRIYIAKTLSAIHSFLQPLQHFQAKEWDKNYLIWNHFRQIIKTKCKKIRSWVGWKNYLLEIEKSEDKPHLMILYNSKIMMTQVDSWYWKLWLLDLCGFETLFHVLSWTIQKSHQDPQLHFSKVFLLCHYFLLK